MPSRNTNKIESIKGINLLLYLLRESVWWKLAPRKQTLQGIHMFTCRFFRTVQFSVVLHRAAIGWFGHVFGVTLHEV